MMTRKQFVAIAHRRGFVRWFPSKKVERLRVASDGNIVAGKLREDLNLQFKEHQIRGVYVDYNCVEILPSDLITIGDMIS